MLSIIESILYGVLEVEYTHHRDVDMPKNKKKGGGKTTRSGGGNVSSLRVSSGDDDDGRSETNADSASTISNASTNMSYQDIDSGMPHTHTRI